MSIGASVVIDNTESVLAAMKSCNLLAPKLALDCVGGNTMLLASGLAKGATIVVYGGLSMQPHVIPTGKLLYEGLQVKGFLLQETLSQDVTCTEFLRAAEQVCLLLKNRRLAVGIDEYDMDIASKPVGDFSVELDTSACSLRAAQVLLRAKTSGNLRKACFKFGGAWKRVLEPPGTNVHQD